MYKLHGVARWLVVATVLYVSGFPALAQVIRLPGGITIGDPRAGGRTTLPGNRPGRPDPNSVCPKTLEWLAVLQKEYPGVDLAHTTGSRVQQMAIPLFSDDSFKKAFGVSYPKLSDSERHEFYTTHIIPCNNQRLFGPQVAALTVFNTPFMPGTVGMGPIAPGQLIPALTRLATARATLRAEEQSLDGNTSSAEAYDRAVALPAERKDDLALVWPGEKAQFEAVVKQTVARSAGVAVEAKIQPLLVAPASPGVAAQLRDAPQTFRTLFAAMPAEQGAQLQARLTERRQAVLRQLLPPQQARASAFPATRQGLDDGADWFREFGSVFLLQPAPSEAEAVAKAYLAHREAALAHMEPQFLQKIESSQDPMVIATLYDDVFRLREDRETLTWQQISTLRTSRAKLLNERAAQAMRAAQEREERAAITRGDIVLSSLKVDGLQNAKFFRTIYAGQGPASGLSRSNFLFAKAFLTYLVTFGQSCQEALPRNRVQMTHRECASEAVYRVTNYGPYGGWYSHTETECERWEDVNYKPAAFADPRAWAAQQGAEKFAEVSMVQETLKKVFVNPLSPFSMMGDIVISKQTMEQDVPALIQENSCNSKALTRLQENMTRLATDQDPLHLPGYQPDRVHTTQAAALDVTRLAGDLVRADATGWMLNKYQGLNGAEIVGEPDGEGRPRRIHATYGQQGFTNEGSVNITFSDGVPSCLYFADAPTTCKTPDPDVMKRYGFGEYRR